jgi:PPP family 3-phenylpropionic acid transporter
MKQKNTNLFIPSYVFSFIAFAVVTPYLSILVRDLGYSTVWVGILLGIFEGTAIAGPFVFGYWADKTGNYRHALIVSCILPALAAIPLVVWIHPAISAALLAVLAFGFRSTTSLLDAVTTIQIGKTGNYGGIRVWGSISFIVFSLFLQWTPFLKPNTAMNISLWTAITSLATIAPVLILPRAFLSSVRHQMENNPAEHTAREEGIPLASVFFIGGFAIIFLCRFAMSAVYSYFPLYLKEELEWDAVGLMFALSSLAEVPFMFISAALVRRFGSLPLLAMSAAGICLRLILWAVFPFKGCIIASQLLHALCFGTYHPAAVHFISTVFPAEKRGVGMPVYLALGTGLPALIGNMIGGGVVEASGFRALFALYAAVAGVAVLIYAVMTAGNTFKKNARRGSQHSGS